MLDSTYPYETPEGIEIRLPIAGPLIRGLAWSLDMLIRIAFYIAAYFILNWLGKVGDGVMLILMFFMEWLFPTVFEAVKGATPGKMITGIQVCMDDGTALTWQASLIRNLLRTVDFLPFFYVIGLIAALSNTHFKRLGDLVASSIVIYRQDGFNSLKKQVKSSNENDEQNVTAEEIYSIKAKPLPFPLTAEEQRTLLHYDERLNTMTRARQQELANLLAPIFQCQNEEAVYLIRQYAAWIRGADK